ncbi:MAG: carboxypeptidase-like regulatory domain-containing protein [Bacteroidales bacterium]|jgi:iron complex outermembrane receptor protein|nr:carboxypeptidase-like regulatory domain-containing protein [Bacteroidales bacterium]
MAKIVFFLIRCFFSGSSVQKIFLYGIMLLLFTGTAYEAVARNGLTVMGLVTDEHNAPLPGATVVAKGSPRGVTADVNGVYTIGSFISHW